MTEFFEVTEHDGAARCGQLRLESPLSTPALVDDVIADAGSLWSEERTVPEGDPDRLTVLPHRAFPSGTPAEVQDAFDPATPALDAPTAAVITPETAADKGTDAYVLSTANGIVGHARAFVEAITTVRRAIPADTALYLPGVATPGNVPILAYAGVDLFDTDAAVVAGTQGRYLTREGAMPIDALDALPCPCPACQRPLSEFDREACVEHNRAVLAATVADVRSRIRQGRLRDYIEGQVRHEQWHTAVMRRLDQEYDYLEARTPLIRRAELTAASAETLDRVAVRRFATRVQERYRARLDSYPLVLLPCSAHKPYSDSRSHGHFRDAIDYRGHIVSLTSPLGVVPDELELTYPAQHYDAVVTGEWSETELAVVADMLETYLANADYPRIIAHVPPEYRPLVERATDREVTYTVVDHPTDEDSLAALEAALDGELQYPRSVRRRAIVRAIADYMIGPGAGDAIFEDIAVEGRYPSLRVTDGSGEQLAAIVEAYGTLAFTLAGARRWVDSDVPTARVEIDAFVPHGSVLAPGVIDADEPIRPGDEVVIEGPRAFGVGRAAMAGPEMAESTRGVAVEVRHVEER